MLPKINAPTFEIVLPISGLNVTFRPFLVKEQKILLMASESDDSSFLITNIKQIIKNCCLTNINVENLSIVDIEFLFINLRAKSVGEVIETKYKCDNFDAAKNGICGNIMDVSYNILDIKVDKGDYNDTIQLTDTVGLKMKAPSFDILNLAKLEETNNLTFEIMKKCIDYIYDENDTYSISETPKEELDEFVDSLNVQQLDKIKNFFKTLPSLKTEVDIICDKCGYNHKINVKGLLNFFG